MGRFLQPDPIGYASGDLNLYAYVGNSPLKYSDPMGLEETGPAERAATQLGFNLLWQVLGFMVLFAVALWISILSFASGNIVGGVIALGAALILLGFALYYLGLAMAAFKQAQVLAQDRLFREQQAARDEADAYRRLQEQMNGAPSSRQTPNQPLGSPQSYAPEPNVQITTSRGAGSYTPGTYGGIG